MLLLVIIYFWIEKDKIRLIRIDTVTSLFESYFFALAECVFCGNAKVFADVYYSNIFWKKNIDIQTVCPWRL